MRITSGSGKSRAITGLVKVLTALSVAAGVGGGVAGACTDATETAGTPVHGGCSVGTGARLSALATRLARATGSALAATGSVDRLPDAPTPSAAEGAPHPAN